MARRVLVAIDGSDSARAAFVFITDWAREVDARAWFIQLTKESSRCRRTLSTDVHRRGRRLANSFTVSGATLSARNKQVASAITDAAHTYRADLIVLGFDPRRMANHGRTAGLLDLVSQATELPVLVAPHSYKPASAPRPSADVSYAVALGPVAAAPADTRLVELSV